MHFSRIAVPLASAVFMTGALAAPTAEPKALHLPFEKRFNFHDQKRSAYNKRSYVVMPLSNNPVTSNYVATLGVGTPPQPVKFGIDTGSSLTAVRDIVACGNPVCTNYYDPTASSTKETLSQTFAEYFADGSYIGGYWFKDSVSVGGVTLPHFEMLAVNASSDPSASGGLIGLSPDPNLPSPIFPQSLKINGLTSSDAFAVYLNDERSTYGSITFGGYDSNLKTGNFFVMPWNLAVTGLAINDTSTNPTHHGYTSIPSASIPFSVALDTGTGGMNIPPDAWDKFADHFGICENDNPGVFCDLNGMTGYLNVELGGGIVIKIDYQELITPVYDGSGGRWTEERNGVQELWCQWVINKGDYGGQFLAQSFLRNVYIIYDGARQQIAIAQAKLNATGTPSIVGISDQGNNLLGQASITTVPISDATGGPTTCVGHW
ncbi:hypothetical protein TWF694_005723 [Orbilia ellipsospora]|uniref:Peptidase A1 domain-containing protein n=1 Tax=Orbilia ellipsospora TaxID=2528407 RepID=A0AAV9WXU7_9PEZI